jgi:FolB domain-containing protein
MADEIFITGLQLRTIIGINGEERRERQDVVVNLLLHVDTRRAGTSDDISDAPLNYRTLAKRIIAMVEQSQFYLIERLAEEIASVCLEEVGVEKVRVTLEKPGALRFARSVGVTIERRASDA